MMINRINEGNYLRLIFLYALVKWVRDNHEEMNCRHTVRFEGSDEFLMNDKEIAEIKLHQINDKYKKRQDYIGSEIVRFNPIKWTDENNDTINCDFFNIMFFFHNIKISISGNVSDADKDHLFDIDINKNLQTRLSETGANQRLYDVNQKMTADFFIKNYDDNLPYLFKEEIFEEVVEHLYGCFIEQMRKFVGVI